MERVTACVPDMFLLQLCCNLLSCRTLVHSYCESLIKLLLGVKILQVWAPLFALYCALVSRGLKELVVRQMRLHLELYPIAWGY